MRFKIASLLIVCVIFAGIAYLRVVRGVKAETVVSYDCEGDACSQVALSWDNDRQQFRVQNESDRSVKVEVTMYAGTSSLQVDAHKSDYLLVKTFTGPYRANYESNLAEPFADMQQQGIPKWAAFALGAL